MSCFKSVYFSDSFPWPFSAIFSKPVPHLKFKAFLTLRRRKGRNALCLLGKSQSNLETKNSHWMLRKKNIGLLPPVVAVPVRSKGLQPH